MGACCLGTLAGTLEGGLGERGESWGLGERILLEKQVRSQSSLQGTEGTRGVNTDSPWPEREGERK